MERPSTPAPPVGSDGARPETPVNAPQQDDEIVAPESAATVVQQAPSPEVDGVGEEASAAAAAAQQPQQPEVDEVDATGGEEEVERAVAAEEARPSKNRHARKQRGGNSKHGRSRRERNGSSPRDGSGRSRGSRSRRRDDREYGDRWEGGRASYRSSVVKRANELLRRIVGDHAPFSNEDDLQESASSMFVAIFETMMDIRLKQVHREPEFSWQYGENAQSVIDGLSHKLGLGLDHIDSGLIAEGDLDHIGALVEVFLVAAGYDDMDDAGAFVSGEEDELLDDNVEAADEAEIERLRRDHPVEWRSLIALRNQKRRRRDHVPRGAGPVSGIRKKAAERRKRFQTDELRANDHDRRARMRELARQDRNDERDERVRGVRAMRMRNEMRRERESSQKRAKSTEHRLARDLFRKTLKDERARLLRSRQRTRELKVAAEANEAAKLEAVEKFYDDQIGMLSDHIHIEREKAKEWKQSRKTVRCCVAQCSLRPHISSFAATSSPVLPRVHLVDDTHLTLRVSPPSRSPATGRRLASACARCTAPRWAS